MDAAVLADRIARGLGACARRIGAEHEVFRPAGPREPIRADTRVIGLMAAFNAEDPSFRKPRMHGKATRFGVFDTGYTRVGDYLRGPAGVFFIAGQDALTPPLLIECNRTVSILRPAGAGVAGVNPSGGGGGERATLLAGWPASVLAAGSGERGTLPGEAGLPAWSVLLPILPVRPRVADLLEDDLGGTLVVTGAEESALGWRIKARQVGV